MKSIKQLLGRLEALEKVADPLRGCIPLILGSGGKKIYFNTPDGLIESPKNFKIKTFPVVSHLLGSENGRRINNE